MTDAAAVLLIDDNVEFVGLLGTLFAEQGLTPYLAHSGTEALFQIERRRHAAIVLDLLLPDTTGQRLLRAMADKVSWLPPVFVITGVFKGEAQRAKVEAVRPIAGWYEKPFDTRLLVERVVSAVGRAVVERKQHQRVGQVTGDFDIDILDPVEVSDDLDLDVDVDVDEDEAVATGDLPREITAPHAYWDSATVAPLAAGLRSPLPATAPAGMPPLLPITGSTDLGDLDDAEPTIVGEPLRGPVEVDETEERERTPTQDPFGETSSGFGASTTPSPAQVAEDLRTSLRSGDLAATSVPRLINAFYIAQETGEIAFERGKQRKIVYFLRGRPVYAVSNQETDRLGVFARRFSSISQKQLHAALEAAKRSDRLLGDVLIDMGLVDPSQRQDLLREQTRGLVRSLFTWSNGRFVIGFHVRTNIEHVELSEHPGALVLSGVRDLFELGRLRGLLADELRPIPAPNPPFGFEELPLFDAEALLILRVTGQRTVRELIDEMSGHLDERGVRATLYSLLCLSVFGLVAR